MDSTAFPLLRITLLGSGGCGKTSIADAFVNNVVERPNPPPPTDFPQLLYKVVRIADEGGDEVRSYCCEIEDTFDASRIDGGRSIRNLVDMKRKMHVDPQGEATTRLISRAELYAQQVFCRLWQVSAFTGKNIKKMFVDMIQLIFANGMLWELDYQEESGSEQSDDEGCTIM